MTVACAPGFPRLVSAMMLVASGSIAEAGTEYQRLRSRLAFLTKEKS
jgi:hypothetical protein